MTRVLITGISGFKGSHLAEYLLSLGGIDVYGTIRWRSKMDNIEHILDKINLINADIRDAYAMQNVVKEVRPDYLIHYAAQSFVQESWRAPAECLDTNIKGTLSVIEAVREVGCDTTIVIAGSSEEYGTAYPDELPIKETNPLRPLSPYAVSKVACDKLGIQYYKSYGMKIIVTRSFNTTGPRRGEVFVTSTFAKQIAEIEAGIKKPYLFVGNLEAKRDFSDVHDIVKAYWLAATQGEPGEVYNLCSENALSIYQVLDILLAMTNVRIKVEKDPSRMRPSDLPVLLGDCSKFKARTGWYPTIPFEQTLSDLLDYWRERVDSKVYVKK